MQTELLFSSRWLIYGHISSKGDYAAAVLIKNYIQWPKLTKHMYRPTSRVHSKKLTEEFTVENAWFSYFWSLNVALSAKLKTQELTVDRTK